MQAEEGGKKTRREREREVSIGMEHELGTTAVGYALSGPFTSGALVSLAVRLVEVGNLWHERVVGIWVGEHGADGEKHLGDGEGWAPLVPENVEADAAVAVDVGVVNLGGEGDLGGLEGVVGGEGDGEEEDTARIRRVAGAHDGCLPLEHVVAGGTG